MPYRCTWLLGCSVNTYAATQLVPCLMRTLFWPTALKSRSYTGNIFYFTSINNFGEITVITKSPFCKLERPLRDIFVGKLSTTMASFMVSVLMPHTVNVPAIKWPSFRLISSFVPLLVPLSFAHAQFHCTRVVSLFLCTRSVALNTIKAEVSVACALPPQQLSLCLWDITTISGLLTGLCIVVFQLISTFGDGECRVLYFVWYVCIV